MIKASDTITSLENPRIKAARKLHTRKGRQTAGQLLVEGVRLLSDAWQSGVRPESVFYVPDASGTGDGAALLDALLADGCACFACAPSVFASLAGTVTPQGIAATLPLPNRPLPATPTLLLILDGVADPGNAGTLLRSAEAACADGVIFGPEAVDPFNDKVVRAGMGAHFRLPLRRYSDWQEIDAFVPSTMRWYGADAHANLPYDGADWRESSVIVVGSEAHGPSDFVRQRSTGIKIPMAGGTESLNAAIAGSIILFEAARQRRLSGVR